MAQAEELRWDRPLALEPGIALEYGVRFVTS